MAWKLESSEIIQGKLWVGPAPDYNDLVGLKERLGPDPVIIDLNRNPREEEACREVGVAYDDRAPAVDDKYVPVPVNKLRLVARIIDEHIQNGRQVYLHCTAGRGRSPTCAAAYLIHSGMSLSEAKNMVKRNRQVWEGKDAVYAALLGDFAQIQEIARASDSE